MLADIAKTFLVALPAVFFVVDPIGAVPIFLAITARDSRAKIHTMALRASVAGGLILVFFALFGGVVFKVLGVSLSAFRVAGGILLLMTALDMLRAKQSATRTSAQEEKEGEQKEDVSLVPLAMPLLSGPGSIATVMVLMSTGRHFVTIVPVLVAVLLTFVATYFILNGAFWVQKALKASGVAILQRVMGLVLAAIAVQFMAEGGKDLLGLH